MAYAKQNLKETFPGGYVIAENFMYDRLPGAPYLKGKDFNIAEKQVEQQKQFNLKLFEVDVTLSKEDIQIFNKGPEQLFSLVKSRMTNAYMTLGEQMAICLYLNGQDAGFTPSFNGLAEAINDGTNVSWNNKTYTTYGGLTRGGTIGSALSSTPTNVNGTIEYTTLEETYGAATFGNIEPNLGVTTVKGYSYVKEKFQTQQRFNDTQDPAIGFNGMKFNSATLIKSRYVPGSDITTTSPQTSSNKGAVLMLTEMTNGAVTAYPSLAVASSETLFWLNARQPYFNFYVTNDEEFGFGITGFKPAQGNTKVACQVLAGCAITFEPRYHQQLFGITG